MAVRRQRRRQRNALDYALFSESDDYHSVNIIAACADGYALIGGAADIAFVMFYV